MKANESIDVLAPVASVYALAQDVANWPKILPHYRSVRVIVESVSERIVVMSARRDWIPVRWTATQRLLPNIPRIEFTHIAGVTVGMRVAWVFEEISGGTRVTITHDLGTLRLPIARSRLGREIIGRFFIAPIASRTLARIRTLAEAPHHA